MDLKKVQFLLTISMSIISPVNLRDISLCLVGKAGGINTLGGIYRQRKKNGQSTWFSETLKWRFGACRAPRHCADMPRCSDMSAPPRLWHVRMRWGSSTCPAELVSVGSVTLHHSGGVQPLWDLSRDVSLYEEREGRVGTMMRLCDECEEIITFLLFCLEIRTTCLGEPGYMIRIDWITPHDLAHNDSNIQWVSNIQ